MNKLLQLLISPLVNAFQTLYKDGKINYNSLVTIIVLLGVLGSFGYHEYSKIDSDKHYEKVKMVLETSDTDVEVLDAGDSDE